MKAVIHIGTGKTGTTSIQNICARQRDRLREKGFLYPRTLGEVNHEIAAACATKYMPGFTPSKTRGISSNDALVAYRRDIKQKLSDEVKASGCDTLLISNEHLFEKVRSAADMKRLLFTLPTLDEVKVVMYVRHQVDFAAVIFSELVRMGTAASRDTFMSSKRTRDLLDYYGGVKIWADQFGDANMIVRPFDRSQFADGDVTTDFFDIAGIDRSLIEDESVAGVRNSRKTLDGTATTFLEMFNLAVEAELARRGAKSRMSEFKIVRHRRLIVDALEQLPASKERYVLNKVQAKQVLKAVAAGNAALEERFGVTLPPPPVIDSGRKSKIAADDLLRCCAALWIETGFVQPQ